MGWRWADKLCLCHLTKQSPLLYTKENNDSFILQVVIVTYSSHTLTICVRVVLLSTFEIFNFKFIMGFDYLTLFCIFSSSNRFIVHFYCTSGVQLCPGIHHEKSVFTMFLVTRCKKKTSLCLCVYGKGSFKEVL